MTHYGDRHEPETQSPNPAGIGVIPLRLSRSDDKSRSAAPVRMVHLGLGNFFRAHQAWYTDEAADASEWGYAAFAGRSGRLATDLRSQGGLYTLVTRSSDGDDFRVVGSLSATHPADDRQAWSACFSAPDLAAVTVTVTEAGYARGPGGTLDRSRSEVHSDLAALESGATNRLTTAPARLVAGLDARRRSGQAGVAVVSCDNIADNGAVLASVVSEMAEMVSHDLAEWIRTSVSFVTTVVDRITPRPRPDLAQLVEDKTGWHDLCPVITEPYHEWILSGDFPGGRPHWESAGAIFTSDPTPYEQRKLWLLNGAHSLLAYTGPGLGYQQVPEAIADERCRSWVEEWWDLASSHLTQSPEEVSRYRSTVLDRFANHRMADSLARIAEDGSQKIPVRVLPVLRMERSAGRLPTAAVRIISAWICHLRSNNPAVKDASAADIVPLAAGPLPDAVGRVVGWLDPTLADDRGLCREILRHARELESRLLR